jgi:hypothetical protein
MHESAQLTLTEVVPGCEEAKNEAETGLIMRERIERKMVALPRNRIIRWCWFCEDFKIITEGLRKTTLPRGDEKHFPGLKESHLRLHKHEQMFIFM